jgi:tight adherence protein B
MTAITWLALGAAVLFLPPADAHRRRAWTLSERGRLSSAQRPPVTVRLPGPERGAPVVCAVVAGVVVMCGGAVLGAAALIATGTVSWLVVVAWRGRQARRREAELLAALRLLAAELDAGSRPSAAFTAAAETCPEHRAELSAAGEACGDGRDPPLAAPALRGLAQAWSVAAVTGAPLADVVRRVADDVAARIEQRRGVAAGVAGARSSAALLAVLPVLGILLGGAMQAHPLDVLLRTGAGQVLCLVGVTLDAAGVLWTQLLTARAERA